MGLGGAANFLYIIQEVRPLLQGLIRGGWWVHLFEGGQRAAFAALLQG